MNILLLIAILAGCGGRHHYPQSLAVADSLADHHPDSAIHYLDDLAPQMADAPEADRMYYQLLRIKAADKAYIPHTSDSLIRPVLEYYEQGGDPQLLPVAYYYGGRVNADLGDAPQAILLFQKALDKINPEKNTLELKGLCYSQIGYLQVQESFYDNAMESFRDALSCFITLRDTMRVLYCFEDIGSTYNFMGERKKGLYTLLKAKKLANMYQSQNYPFLDNQIARTYLFIGQADSATIYISKALSTPTPSTTFPSYSIAANIYKDIHEADSMKRYAELLLGGDLINKRYAYRLLGEYHLEKGELDSAVSFFKNWADINDTIDEISATKTVAQLQATYNYQLREKENQKLKYESKIHMGIIAASVIFCLLLCLMILLLVKYLKRKNALLKLKLEKYERIVSEYQKKMEEKKQLTSSGLLNSDLYWQLKKNVAEGIHITDDQVKELTVLFSREKPAFREELTQLTKVNDYQYLVCMLVAIGFNAADIAMLLCKTPQAINSVRQRLYEKAFGEKGSPKKWDDIIHSLSAV
ncbi:MAG: hypothetical protein IKX36_10160 [Prevotella sp.]|nr:hypothetical protein [Prevotella sp.]